ncbi:M3 family oligoendopeptidase [Roseinatronobacter bogoriensis]|uniref:Oligoendopeptidase F n=1 Tax=Roseinatronobacter bogoriensis subsp. barguzinensis TaxID=441209 RepID=A0A2K8KA95_9RHOB|nr:MULTISPECIES: M3 family oligoendopeptidase [Rhodobaca]ATX66379.1 oligoendopeptidase F [Rhodobaca barguzinensis]MBB4207516.1 oligoendopeptidase F [Rhodobaca bogoriensis DSM 18756]TDW40177.1 oligoendopeptidase F [Rhodobaca barguzinensis]TDY70671.1 oligoendopeptidase F [Rhodobaca bogoriensis DSM 18756]
MALDQQSCTTTEFGDLPDWDLSALYTAPDAPELARDFDFLETECADFARTYEGKLAQLDAAGMLDCVRRYEKIDIIAGRLMSYAGLRYYQNSIDPERAKFLSDAQDRVTVATTPLVFFSLEMNRIDDATFEALLAANADLARYRTVFERMRAMRPYQLSDELEKFLHDQSTVGAAAWNRLFDETMAGLEFEVAGEEEPLGLEATLNLLTDADRARREAGARALAEVFGKNIKLFARVHNTLAKEKEIEDRWRKMPTPQTARHLANHVEPEVVEALRNSVVAAYPRLSHRYYALKAKWLGLETLEIWDRNAPLPMEAPRKISWDEARATVMEAYTGFSPKLAELTEPFFTQGWIDAAVKPGKAPGAFAHPTVTEAHPYVMLNYLGKPRDVMTLAHELGHGVHQRLAAGQGELLSSTPLTLAETASVFGEMLTFRRMLANAKSQAERKVLLADKVEDMINTVVRQIAFYDFECKLHDARRGGELTPEDINALWMSVQAESLGPVFDYMDGYESFWAYIPHFVHSPFYVYAYAFGDGLVNALYAAYEDAPEGFEEKYFELLSAGGSKHHKDLLAPFGLDASDPAFWDKGLEMIAGFIDELEAME